MRVRLADTALEDLDAIASYIGATDPFAADRVLDDIQNALDNLSHFPEIGRPSRKVGLRELVIVNLPYIALYSIHDNDVWVYQILHGATDWKLRDE